MRRRRWVFGAVAVAGVVALVAPAVGQGWTAPGSLGWSRSRGGATITSYDFRSVDGGSRLSKGFRLGSSSLTKTGRLAIRLTGSSAFSITSDKCVGKSIGRSLSCWVGVAYAPGVGAHDSATLRAADGHGAAASLDLTGCSPTTAPGHVYWVSSAGTVKRVPVGGGCVSTLGSDPYRAGASGPHPVAVDNTNVYWVDQVAPIGTVNAVPVGGGSVTTLASGQNQPISVAADGAHVYWADYGLPGNGVGGTVNEIAPGGGSITTLAGGQDGPAGVAVDGSYVYWLDNNGGTVNRAPLGGGAVTTLASGQDRPWSIAVDGAHVYWGSALGDGTLKEVPLDGGSVTTLASGHDIRSVAADGANVYWVDWGDWTVNQTPAGGGIVTTLVSGSRRPTSVAVDGANVYWINGLGLHKVPIGGGRVTTLVDHPNGYYLAVGP